MKSKCHYIDTTKSVIIALDNMIERRSNCRNTSVIRILHSNRRRHLKHQGVHHIPSWVAFDNKRLVSLVVREALCFCLHTSMNCNKTKISLPNNGLKYSLVEAIPCHTQEPEHLLFPTVHPSKHGTFQPQSRTKFWKTSVVPGLLERPVRYSWMVFQPSEHHAIDRVSKKQWSPSHCSIVGHTTVQLWLQNLHEGRK